MVYYQHFIVEHRGPVVVVHLSTSRMFDTLVVSELQDELIEYLETVQPEQVVISFDGVVQCSTAVINTLLRAKKRIITNGGRLILCCMSKPIRDAYRMLNLDGTVFEIHDREAQAIKAFDAGAESS